MNVQNNQEAIARTTNAILLIVFLSVALFFTLQRVDGYIKNKAIYECGLISKFEQSDDKTNTKVSYPVADIYKQCLKNKGILR